MISLQEFEKEFFIEINNDFYESYLMNTKLNYKLYKEYTTELNANSSTLNDPNKIIYFYIDEDRLRFLKFELKKILKNQRNLLSNLKQHVIHIHPSKSPSNSIKSTTSAFSIRSQYKKTINKIKNTAFFK